MSQFLFIVPKTLFFYLVLVVVMKVMGKREVGQLSIFDMAVFFIISDMFSLSIDGGLKLIGKTSIATITIVFLQLITSKIILKSNKLRNVVDGEPSLLIKEGKIDQEEMKRQRYNIDDLFTQLREKDIKDITTINYAILESSGLISIIRKEDDLLFPFPFIKDGEVDNKALDLYGKDEKWLISNLNGVRIEDIFLALLRKNGMYIVKRKLS